MGAFPTYLYWVKFCLLLWINYKWHNTVKGLQSFVRMLRYQRNESEEILPHRWHRLFVEKVTHGSLSLPCQGLLTTLPVTGSGSRTWLSIIFMVPRSGVCIWLLAFSFGLCISYTMLSYDAWKLLSCIWFTEYLQHNTATLVMISDRFKSL